MTQTFEQRCATMRENGNPDPTGRPVWETFPKRGDGDQDARWHFTASLGVWGDLGWLKARELETRVAELEARTVASAEIAEGTLYGTEEAIQGLKRTLEAGVELARAITR